MRCSCSSLEAICASATLPSPLIIGHGGGGCGKGIFANDHVMLSEEHLPELRSLTKEIAYGLSDGTFPYVPRCFKAPYYYYVGEKVAEPDSQFHSSSRGASAGGGTSASASDFLMVQSICK